MTDDLIIDDLEELQDDTAAEEPGSLSTGE